VVAGDISPDALQVARRNARRLDVDDRVLPVRCDLLLGLCGRFDVIVSNPPYVPTGDLAGLQPEIREHEPVDALDGGSDGLDVIRRLVPEAAGRLKAGGLLVVEFGFGQAAGIRAIVAGTPNLELDGIRDDLAGIPRVVIARASRES
jgi:release factor glutamine methyltransferase